MIRKLAVLLCVAELLALGACGTHTQALEPLRRQAVCAVGQDFGRLDILPWGSEGIALRIVTHDTHTAIRRLRQQDHQGRLSRVLGRVFVESPRPQIAIIIDDLGLREGQLEPFWRLGQAFTWSILPHQAWSKDYARWLSRRGASVLVHLPLEPFDSAQMSFPGFLTATQTPANRAELVRRAFSQITGAIGFNNHMGSRFTSDSSLVAELLRIVPSQTLIVDSRTTHLSVLGAMASRRGPTVDRHVFLDNVREVEAIVNQLEKALARARSHGVAVAIGHAHPETAEALRRFLRDYGDVVHIVPIEHVVRPTAPSRWLAKCQSPSDASEFATRP